MVAGIACFLTLGRKYSSMLEMEPDMLYEVGPERMTKYIMPDAAFTWELSAWFLIPLVAWLLSLLVRPKDRDQWSRIVIVRYSLILLVLCGSAFLVARSIASHDVAFTEGGSWGYEWGMRWIYYCCRVGSYGVAAASLAVVATAILSILELKKFARGPQVSHTQPKDQ